MYTKETEHLMNLLNKIEEKKQRIEFSESEKEIKSLRNDIAKLKKEYHKYENKREQIRRSQTSSESLYDRRVKAYSTPNVQEVIFPDEYNKSKKPWWKFW